MAVWRLPVEVACRICGMTTTGDAICGFCIMSDRPKASIASNRDILIGLIDEVLGRSYEENPKEPQEEPSQPQNITIPQSKVEDIIRFNEWAKNILFIAYGKYPPGSKMYVLRSFSEEHIDDITRLLKAKRVYDPYARPVIVESGWTEKYWKIIELLAHIFGRYVARWFEQFPRSEWKRQRILFYINAWELGNLYRHGKPAASTSPWLLGERKPINGDPFGQTPIGSEQ